MVTIPKGFSISSAITVGLNSALGYIAAIPILLQGDTSPEYVKNATDSSKNEKHGDGGKALEKGKERIGELHKESQKAKNRKEEERLKIKARHIRENGERKRKGEEHSHGSSKR